MWYHDVHHDGNLCGVVKEWVMIDDWRLIETGILEVDVTTTTLGFFVPFGGLTLGNFVPHLARSRGYKFHQLLF